MVAASGSVTLWVGLRLECFYCYHVLKWDIDTTNIVTKAQALEPRGKGIKWIVRHEGDQLQQRQIIVLRVGSGN
jgi:hypothetical protein